MYSILSNNFDSCFITFNVVIWRCFQFGLVKNLSVGKELTLSRWQLLDSFEFKMSADNRIMVQIGLTLSQTTIFSLTKLKPFADNKLNTAKMMISLFDKVENTVGNGENAGYQHFLLFPQSFRKPSSFGTLKVWIVW